MEPANIRFGGGASSTLLHPLVAVAMILAILMMFVLSRKYIIVPFLFATFLIPLGQVLIVGGLHFTVLRIVIIFGCFRLLILKLLSQLSPPAGGFNKIDMAFSCWAFFYALDAVLLWMSRDVLVNRLGFLVDAFGAYFFLRFLIRNDEDIRRTFKVFAFIAAIMSVCMLSEQVAQRNVFGLLGGVAAIPALRDGKLRSQGVFQHAILAGTFGATLLPWFIWLWRWGRSKSVAALGLVGSTIITLTSASSAPILAYASGILGLCFWPFRRRMRTVRWGLALTLVGLHLMMKAPVWALIARIDLTGSSSGYHRFMLVDNAIRYISSWWLFGVKDYNTWGWDMWDLSNQYVAYALAGGLACFIAFIAIISRGFGMLGSARQRIEGNRKQDWLMWSLGSAMFAHVMGYFGTAYWDQTQVAWYSFLAIIGAATASALVPPAEEVAVEIAALDEDYAPQVTTV